MFCASCGSKLPAGARFCGGCGQTVQGFTCYQCQKPITGKVLNVDGDPTCEQCNAEMDAAIGLALTNAQQEHNKFGGFLDKKF